MRRLLVLAAGVAVTLPQHALAQQASQHAIVSQTVYTTEIRMEYDRPVARGRALFGALVEWDAIWTPGANRATWIDFSKPVTFQGTPLDAGRYAIWLIPHENEPWEAVIVSEWDTHHGIFPFDAEVARFRIEPEQSSHMETLAFYFPVVGRADATLRFHWGTTVLPFRIEVGRN